MKARFFYAEPIFKTWSKLCVLTEDGTFYCEYLNYMKPAKIQEKFDFHTFKATDYKCEGYQPIVEINKDRAMSIELTRQANWIGRYLSKVNWVKDYLNNQE